jgi:hypothetical protein
MCAWEVLVSSLSHLQKFTHEVPRMSFCNLPTMILLASLWMDDIFDSGSTWMKPNSKYELVWQKNVLITSILVYSGIWVIDDNAQPLTSRALFSNYLPIVVWVAGRH